MFTDPKKQPTSTALTTLLNTAAPIWVELVGFIESEHGPIVHEWKFMKSGWVLVPKRKTRAICYLTPAENSFSVAMALGEKAVAVALQNKLPARIVTLLDDAPKYAEGRGVRIVVKNAADLPPIKKLIAAKLGT